MKKCVSFIIIIERSWCIKMNNYIILDKRKNIKKIERLISELQLTNSLNNRRTSMWENDDIEINIDRHIIRIYIYNNKDISYYSNIFIGD